MDNKSFRNIEKYHNMVNQLHDTINELVELREKSDKIYTSLETIGQDLLEKIDQELK